MCVSSHFTTCPWVLTSEVEGAAAAQAEAAGARGAVVAGEAPLEADRPGEAVVEVVVDQVAAVAVAATVAAAAVEVAAAAAA